MRGQVRQTLTQITIRTEKKTNDIIFVLRWSIGNWITSKNSKWGTNTGKDKRNQLS